MNMLYKLSFLVVVFVAAAKLSVTSAAGDTSIFQGVQEDDAAAITSSVQTDPSALESIGPGGQTPLIHAVLTGKATAVKTLLELGADALATEKDGYDVLHAAGFQGRAQILQILLDHFREAGADKSLDPETDRHRDGYFPLHRACWGREHRHTETVRVFLKHGVPHDLPSEKGITCKQMTRNEGTLAALAESSDGYEL